MQQRVHQAVALPQPTLDHLAVRTDVVQDATGVAKDGAPINFAAALQARVWQKNQLRKRRQRLRHNVRLDLCRGGHILQHGRDQFHYFVVAAILQQRHQRRQVAHYKFRAKAEVAQRAQSVALTIEIWALQQLHQGKPVVQGARAGLDVVVLVAEVLQIGGGHGAGRGRALLSERWSMTSRSSGLRRPGHTEHRPLLAHLTPLPTQRHQEFERECQ